MSRGLDFGTSTTYLVDRSARRAEIVALGSATRWLPTVVGVTPSGLLPGDAATTLPEAQVLRSVKRSITTKEQFRVVWDGTQLVEINVDEAITAFLRHTVARADERFVSLREPGVRVHIGCPAMWTNSQRERLRRLAIDSGIPADELALIDEPIAAGVAWIQQRLRADIATHGKVVVFDMGGGTLDVAVLDVEADPQGTPSIAVQASEGVNDAGDTLDEQITRDVLVALAGRGFTVDQFPNGELDRGWITRAAKEAKEQLSVVHEVEVAVDHPTVDVPRVRYSRAELVAAFRQQLSFAIDRTVLTLRAALMTQVASSRVPESMSPMAARKKTAAELFAGVDHLVLVGGMANVPAIFEAFAEHVPADRIHCEADPASMVARGLSDSGEFEQLNMHRPGFDIDIEWDGGRHTAYAAHTPLYTDYDIFNRNATDRVFRLANKLPSRGEGRLVVRSPGRDSTREQIPIRVSAADGSQLTDSLPFAFGSNADALLKIAQNGAVLVRHGDGREMRFTIKHWPVIKGRGNERIELEVPKSDVQEKTWWYDLSGD